jgi:hypothetical protein
MTDTKDERVYPLKTLKNLSLLLHSCYPYSSGGSSCFNSKAMSDSPEDDHVQDVALVETSYTSTTTSSGKRKLILLGFLIVAAIVLQSVVLSCKPVSIPLESRDEEDDPTSSGKRHRRHLMQQEETEYSYHNERELRSSKARSRARKSKKASSPKSAKAHRGKKSTQAPSGKKSKKKLRLLHV